MSQYTLNNVEVKLRTSTPANSPLQLHRLTNPIDVRIHVLCSQSSPNEQCVYTIETWIEKLMGKEWMECSPNPYEGNNIKPLFKDYNVYLITGTNEKSTNIPSAMDTVEGRFLYFEIPRQLVPMPLIFEIVLKMNTSKEKQGYKRGQEAIFRFSFRLMKHTFNDRRPIGVVCVQDIKSFHFGVINHGKTDKAAEMYSVLTNSTNNTNTNNNNNNINNNAASRNTMQTTVQDKANHAPSPASPPHKSTASYTQTNVFWDMSHQQLLSFVQNYVCHQKQMEQPAQNVSYQDLEQALKLIDIYNQNTNHQNNYYNSNNNNGSSSSSSPVSFVTNTSDDNERDLLNSDDFLDNFDVNMVESNGTNELLNGDEDLCFLDDNFQFGNISASEYLNQYVNNNYNNNSYMGLLTGNEHLNQSQWSLNNIQMQQSQYNTQHYASSNCLEQDQYIDYNTFDNYFANRDMSPKSVQKERSISNVAFNLTAANMSASSSSNDLSQFNFGQRPSVSAAESYQHKFSEQTTKQKKRNSPVRLADSSPPDGANISSASVARSLPPLPSSSSSSALSKQSYFVPRSAERRVQTNNIQVSNLQSRTRELSSNIIQPMVLISFPPEAPKEQDKLYHINIPSRNIETNLAQDLQKLSLSGNTAKDVISFKLGAVNKRDTKLHYIRRRKQKVVVFEIGDSILFGIKPNSNHINVEAMIQIVNYPGKLFLGLDNREQLPSESKKKMFVPIQKNGSTALLDTSTLPQSKRLIIVTLYAIITQANSKKLRVAIIPQPILLVPKGSIKS
jgi:hypothetical protein